MTEGSAVGRAIKRERERRGWSIRKLAALAGVDHAAISRLESGGAKDARQGTVARVAVAFGITPDELLGSTRPTVEAPPSSPFGPVVLIPIVNISLAAGTTVYGETRETVPIPAELVAGRSLVAARVTGECMEPEIRAGDLAVVDISNRSPRPGQLVAVLLEWGLIARNPCEVVHPPKVPKVHYRVLSGDEALILLERVQGHPLECIVTLAFTTGLREGELLGLRWQDVDLVRGLLMVRQQAQRIPRQGWYFPEPKSDASNRIVILTHPGMAALLRQEARVELMKAYAGEAWADLGLVHPNNLGRPIEKGNLLRRWKGFLAKNQLPEMTIHELRHSTATVLFSLKVPIPVIQEILGHSSISITSDIYRGFVPPLHREAMDKLNALLSRRDPELSSTPSSLFLPAPSGSAPDTK